MFRRPRMRTYTMPRQMHRNNAHTMIHKITHNIKLFQLTHNTYTMPTCTHKNMIMDVLLFSSSFTSLLSSSLLPSLSSPDPHHPRPSSNLRVELTTPGLVLISHSRTVWKNHLRCSFLSRVCGQS